MEGTCHCGSVTWKLAQKPPRLVTCNCSICRKLGTLWAHVPVDDVTLSGETLAYIRKDSDGDLAFHSCQTCGVTTHWAPTKEDGEVMAVNALLADPEALNGIPRRLFDGADTWAFLD